MDVKMPLGIESFAKIREENLYYVDKTSFIKELLCQPFEASLVTRPRRFGKTLTMSMMEDFLDISRDSKAHFAGLEISRDTEFCEAWMNQYPVIFISLKDVEGLNYQKAYGMIKVLMAELCRKYTFLESSGAPDPADQMIFKDLKLQRASEENVKSGICLLMRMMAAHYGKPVILLVDEYDVPLAKAHDAGYYEEMLDFIRAMLGKSLKTNPYLKFAVVTGCLKISKESVFTGINNLVSNTITADRLDESIGFTEPEVQAILSAAGLSDHAEEVRNWYDGYRFGSVDVYCPWDVLNHVAALQENPEATPKTYWVDTSSNHILYSLFENKEFDVNEKFETLLAGGCIRERITEDLTYHSLEASEESLWSLLFMTGYLTMTKTRDSGYINGELIADLKIPNEEIKIIFRRAVVSWFRKEVQTMDRSALFRALWNENTAEAAQDISDFLFDSISYHDYKESYYHAFVAGMFAGAGYIVESNYEYGNGRPDIVIKEKRKRRIMLFEVKHAGKNETLEHACREATEQIRRKRYAEAFDGYRTIISYGIAFKGKDCLIEKAG